MLEPLLPGQRGRWGGIAQDNRRFINAEQDKRGLNTKMHLAVDANGMPVGIVVTEGTRADCKEAVHLIEGIDAERWRGIATRHAKRLDSFVAAVQIRCIALWLDILA